MNKQFKVRVLLCLVLSAGLSSCATVDKASKAVVNSARSVVGLSNPIAVSKHGDFALFRLLAKFGKVGATLNLSSAPGAVGEQLYVVDGLQLKQLDLSSLKGIELSGLQESALETPTAVSANTRVLLVSSEATGRVYRIDRQTGAVLLEVRDLNKPRGIVELSDGSLLVAESGSGKITLISGSKGETRREMASGLSTPSGMVNTVGGVYITETDTGSILRLDPVSGRRTVLTQGLKSPQGITLTSTGRLAVLEVGAAQISIVDPASGGSTVRANNLPLDMASKAYTSLTAAGNENLFFGSSADGALYQLRKK
jgi:streptogramin lyase